MRRAALSTFLGAAVAVAAASPALADTPGQPQTTPAPAPAPAPKPGRATLTSEGGLLSHGRRYVLAGDAVTMLGRVTPYVPGQILKVRVSAPHRKPALAHARVARGGTFKIRFRARRAVEYTVRISHEPTAQQARFHATATATAVAPHSGIGVALLKQGMRALGYPAGSGPAVTDKLGRELLAFRKVNGMPRVYTSSRRIYEMVFAGEGSFKLRYPGAGKHVEADLGKQVVVLADHGRPVGIYPTSSGKPSTPTVLGHYRFYSKTPGTNAKGMFMSNYFIRGYAIHGYPDVPTYTASHGCLRVPNADAVSIYNQIALGESIWVYL